MTRRFPVPGDERVKYFFPYIYMGDGDYFYFVTPVGSFRVNQSFDSFAFKLGVSVTIGLIAGALVWHYFHREEPKKKESSKKKEDSVREVLLKSKEPTNLVKMVKKRWTEADGVVKKDFGRLAPSLSVMRSEGKEEKHPIYMSMNLKRSKGLKVEKLEKIEICRAVTKALYSALGSSDALTTLSYLDTPDQVFDHIKRSNPVLFGVLRAVNQSVIMPAIFHLNLEILKTPMPVLDKPGFDSWLVEVDVSSSGILVRHLRWARSTSDENSKDYFEFRWVLAIGLDLNAQNMTSCELSVVEFKSGDNMASADQRRVCSLLGLKP